MTSGGKKYDYQFKLVMIGDTGVGKSSILLRFADSTFSDNFISTIGVDFRFRTVKVDKKEVKLQIWDTAGQERFKTITSAYYRGADGIVLAYDVTSMESFNHVKDWLVEVNRYASEFTCKLIVGNKCDRTDRVVPIETAQAYANSLGIPFMETSAKEDTNIDKVFLQLAAELLRTKDLRLRSSSYSNRSLTASVGPNGAQEESSSSCC